MSAAGPVRKPPAAAAIFQGSSSDDENQTKLRKVQERIARLAAQSQLIEGEPFRPHRIFHYVVVMPKNLLALACVSPGAKLAWLALSDFKGSEGDCYPSWKGLGEKLGVHRTQAKRWVDELVKKGLACYIHRPPPGPGKDWETNQFELLWRKELSEGDVKKKGIHKSCTPPGHNSSIPGIHKSCPEKIHHPQKLKENEKKIKKEVSGSTCSANWDASTPYKKEAKKAEYPSRSDDDEKLPKREPLADPEAEFLARLEERHGAQEGHALVRKHVLEIVMEGLKYDPAALREFLEFDAAQTAAPKQLRNPGGYYRALLKKFREAKENQTVAAKKEYQQLLNKHYAALHAPARVAPCSLSICNGTGELYKGNVVVGICECEAGLRVPPGVRRMLESKQLVTAAS